MVTLHDQEVQMQAAFEGFLLGNQDCSPLEKFLEEVGPESDFARHIVKKDQVLAILTTAGCEFLQSYIMEDVAKVIDYSSAQATNVLEKIKFFTNCKVVYTVNPETVNVPVRLNEIETIALSMHAFETKNIADMSDSQASSILRCLHECTEEKPLMKELDAIDSVRAHLLSNKIAHLLSTDKILELRKICLKNSAGALDECKAVIKDVFKNTTKIDFQDNDFIERYAKFELRQDPNNDDNVHACVRIGGLCFYFGRPRPQTPGRVRVQVCHYSGLASCIGVAECHQRPRADDSGVAVC